MLDQAKLMKQAFDMKRKMDKTQKELSKRELVVQYGSATITITGDQQIREVKLDPTVQEMENIRELEATIKNAFNKAISESQEAAKKELQAITGGLNIPGLT
ncbi:MAG TPA: YbaB/EbfC family nucleoid-associated protein [bacterium]|nr:YbaB/EbfC family nucleoid-associated protein [bacterium]